MAKKTTAVEGDKARTLKCIVTGKAIRYCGYGRPPKYSAEGRAKIDKDRRAKAANGKGKAKGKSGRPRKAA